jgi:hypothetical protein
MKPADRDAAIIREITATGFVKGVNLHTERIETLTRQNNSVVAAQANKSFDFMRLPTEIQAMIFGYIGLSERNGTKMVWMPRLERLGIKELRSPVFRFLGDAPHRHLQHLHNKWLEQHAILEVRIHLPFSDALPLYDPTWPRQPLVRAFRRFEITLDVWEKRDAKKTDLSLLRALRTSSGRWITLPMGSLSNSPSMSFHTWRATTTGLSPLPRHQASRHASTRSRQLRSAILRLYKSNSADQMTISSALRSVMRTPQ